MKHFRIYSSMIVAVFVMLLGYNLYCLFRLYDGISRQTTELITQSLRDADLDEILNRANRYPISDSIPDYQGRQLSQSRSIMGDTLYVTIFDDNDEIIEVRRQPLVPGTNYSDIMVNEIGYGAHQTLDLLYPLRIADLDSLFRLSLLRKGIKLDIASVIRVSSDGKVTDGDAELCNDSSLDSVSVCYNILGGARYVAYFSSPMGYIFRQMSGIVISTIAIIVLIAIAFRYLFHTVSKLRTIEEMKDDFVNNMTHELKTPIAIAYSANDALLNFSDADDPGRSKRYLEIALAQLTRLGGLVENILSMSMERRRSVKLNYEEVRLGRFMEEIALAQRLRSDKPVDITVYVNPDTLTVKADPMHLANVMNNLIDNAIKYSYDTVCIEIRCDAGGISVSDNGMGIPAKCRSLVFNRFYRVPHGNRHDISGHGIGLYYVKCVVEKMGWGISVRSREGKGSVFEIKIR